MKSLEQEYADALTDALNERGRQSSQARKDGLCDHGWRQGKPGQWPPADGDMMTCLHCGKIATRGELDDDAREIYATY
jgi:hypothetical protein